MSFLLIPSVLAFVIRRYLLIRSRNVRGIDTIVEVVLHDSFFHFILISLLHDFNQLGSLMSMDIMQLLVTVVVPRFASSAMNLASVAGCHYNTYIG